MFINVLLEAKMKYIIVFFICFFRVAYVSADDTFFVGKFRKSLINIQVCYPLASATHRKSVLVRNLLISLFKKIGVDSEATPEISTGFKEDEEGGPKSRQRCLSVETLSTGCWRIALPSWLHSETTAYYILSYNGEVAISWAQGEAVAVILPKEKCLLYR